MSGSKEAELKKTEQINEAIKKLDTSAFTIHRKTVEESIKDLGADRVKGLTSAQAEKKVAEHGLNELEKEEETSIWERILEQFQDLLV
jgi:magnesium-transporting ATPase (P-type)